MYIQKMNRHIIHQQTYYTYIYISYIQKNIYIYIYIEHKQYINVNIFTLRMSIHILHIPITHKYSCYDYIYIYTYVKDGFWTTALFAHGTCLCSPITKGCSEGGTSSKTPKRRGFTFIQQQWRDQLALSCTLKVEPIRTLMEVS